MWGVDDQAAVQISQLTVLLKVGSTTLTLSARTRLCFRNLSSTKLPGLKCFPKLWYVAHRDQQDKPPLVTRNMSILFITSDEVGITT